jgi:hypothetical protein
VTWEPLCAEEAIEDKEFDNDQVLSLSMIDKNAELDSAMKFTPVSDNNNKTNFM